MAEVKMPLEELRELERQRDDAQQELSIVKDRLMEVEANKMIVHKTITVYPSYQSFEVDRWGAESIAKELTSLLSRRGEDIWSRNRLTRIIIPPIHTHHLNLYAGNNNTEITYINFEDVQRELREEAESKVAQELGELRSKVHTNAKIHYEEISTLKATHELQRRELVSKHKEEVKVGEDLYLKLKKEYDTLKQDKDMRTTEQKLIEEIEHLKETIYELRSMSFWQKVKDLFQ